jgi:integrase/recombinase XerC
MGRPATGRTNTIGDRITLPKQKRLVVTRKNSRGGRSATEHLIAAIRCLYRHAVADNVIPEFDNPAQRIAKPRRQASTRRAIPEARLAEILAIAAATGNDKELDALILRLHSETACRRGGALALRPHDLDTDQSLVMLHEKGDTTRWQPISPTLMSHLLDHARTRGAEANAQLLRYRNGQPITARRYATEALITRGLTARCRLPRAWDGAVKLSV